MTAVLVVNSGSSSFKYQLIEMDTETTVASGLVERIGELMGTSIHTVFTVAQPESDLVTAAAVPSSAATAGGSSVSAPAVEACAPPSPSTSDALAGAAAVVMTPEKFTRELSIPNHTAGFAVMLEAFAQHGPSLELHAPVAVGHRVVHGGARFHEPTIVTEQVERDIDELSSLAPLHNPGALQGIVAAIDAFSTVPHVAIFDTAFHQTLPPEAFTYAINVDLAEKFRVRRYGFHGTSHGFVARSSAEFLQRDAADLNQIVLHLGNGGSVCAVRGGKSVETSMGMTPLEGLVMEPAPATSIPACFFTSTAVRASTSTISTRC